MKASFRPSPILRTHAKLARLYFGDGDAKGAGVALELALAIRDEEREGGGVMYVEPERYQVWEVYAGKPDRLV